MIGSHAGIGHCCDENFAFLKSVQLCRVEQHVSGALADLFADRNAGRKRRSVIAGQLVLLDKVRIFLRVNRFGPRLQNEQLAGDPVLCPLDVHRLALTGEFRIVVFDRACPLRKLQHFESRKAKSVPLRLDDIADLRAGPVVGEHHLDFFHAKLSRDDRTKSFLEGRLENDPFVRCRHALNDGFAESPRTVDHDRLAKTAFGIKCEHHTRTRDVRSHHRLDPDR